MVNLNMHEKELTIESIERMDFVTMAAGLSLILVSVLVATDRFDILRNFVFSGFLGFTFLLIACWRIFTGRYDHDNPIDYVNKYGIVLGISLIVVAVMILFDAWGPIRSGWLPIMAGIMFIIIASYDTAKQIHSPGNVLRHINIASIIGGELLILYGILLHYGQVEIIWSPLYSGVFAIVLCTVSLAYGMQSVTERRYVEVKKKEQVHEVVLTPKAPSPKPMAIRISDELFSDQPGVVSASTSTSNDIDLTDILQEKQTKYNAAVIGHKIYNTQKPEPISHQKIDTSYISSEAGKPLGDATFDAHGLSDILENARKIKQNIKESRGEW